MTSETSSESSKDLCDGCRCYVGLFRRTLSGEQRRCHVSGPLPARKLLNESGPGIEVRFTTPFCSSAECADVAYSGGAGAMFRRRHVLGLRPTTARNARQ